ncbi:MAG: hypothetical protein HYR64_04440 [Fimbriimonas ginsengisoli]|uniref:Uncharacterized protein n=1 Tax=Fimbriimonas ginsengisoli TaxID=1005039 RepID=A0A931LWW4_FIMGI|nr:hypothetical protein [Fimbriimonas ginsengisoli]
MIPDLVIGARDTLTDVAFKVCTALSRGHLTAVLSGGGAATVWSEGAYQSGDLDFIVEFMAGTVDLEQPMTQLGYDRQGRHYVHRRNQFIVEFPDDQILIGSESVTEYDSLTKGVLKLHILTPTDCVRDRLCSFFWYTDISALQAAVLVASKQVVDIRLVEDWAALEGESAKFAEFMRAFTRNA